MIVMKMMVMVKRMAQFLQEALSQHLSCQQRRLFAARAQSGSLVRALGRTLSRPTQGRDDASDENVSSIYICFVLYLYLYLHLESPKADILFCVCISSVFIVPPQEGAHWRCCLSDKQCLRRLKADPHISSASATANRGDLLFICISLLNV